MVFVNLWPNKCVHVTAVYQDSTTDHSILVAYAENSTEVVKTYSRDPIECYACNSDPAADGKKCEDPIDPSITKKTCRSGLCLKYVQDGEDVNVFYWLLPTL